MKKALSTAIAVLLLAGCGSAESVTETDQGTTSYSDCVAGIPMDASDPQQYIDEVAAQCGDPE